MILQLEKLTPFRYWIAGGAFLAVVFLAGVQTVRLNAEQVAHERTKTSHAQVLQGLAEKTAAAYAAVEKAAAAVREELAAADQKHTEEMSHAKTENERLRAAARTGAVSVRFTDPGSPSPAADLSETPFSSSLGHGVPALDAELRERVFDHRAAVIQAENQILYLQDYARLCAAGAAP